jgi:hypothetical protein
LDYEPFDAVVPITDASGSYYEADPTFWKGPPYWGQGVRPLSAARMAVIERVAGASALPAVGIAKKPASPDASIEVDKYAKRVAMAHVRSAYPGDVVEEMPHNNPGFDIRVGPEDAEVQFVEVKGTQSSEATFFLSEGERKFSEREAARYTFLVVVGINLKGSSHAAIEQRVGAVNGFMAVLEPYKWTGRLV